MRSLFPPTFMYIQPSKQDTSARRALSVSHARGEGQHFFRSPLLAHDKRLPPFVSTHKKKIAYLQCVS